MASAAAKPRVALVLGSGGIVGGAYHAGVLKALHDTWGIDARQVDLIVGTSAGSIVGALVVAGLHPNDLFRRETGKPLSPGGQKLLNKARALRGPKPNPRSAIGVPAAPEVLWQALTRPHRVSPGAVAASLLPRGSVSTDHMAGMVDGLLGSSWPSLPALKICAVELARAKRVVFGRSDGGATATTTPTATPTATATVATPAEAVAASCAVPTVFEPVTIGGVEYHDGGVHSPDNLDVIGDSPYDLVVVSSPMTSDQAFQVGRTWDSYRQVARWQTDRERRRLSNCPRVEIVRPSIEDLEAMGPNLLDPKRRPAVAFQAHASACARFSRLPDPPSASLAGINSKE